MSFPLRDTGRRGVSGGACAPVDVMHVTETAQGGVGTYLEELLPLQAEQYGQHAVRAVLPGAHAALFPGLAAHWLSTYDPGSGGRLAGSLRMAVAAWREIQSSRPRIVHLHSTWAGLVMRPLLALLAHPPAVVYCPHGWAFERKVGRVQVATARALERWLAAWTDAVVCVSRHEHDQGRAIGIEPPRLRTVLNGIADQPAGLSCPGNVEWPTGCLKILFVGRLDEQKGVDVLFAAMERLHGRAHAVVVGSSVVKDGRAELPVPANVRVVGWRNRREIASLYESADVLVAPSRWEALPLVPLEAMRAGLAVVATRVGGLPEVVEDGVTGHLVASEDADALAQVLAGADPSVLREMGSRGRRRYLDRFQAHRVASEIHQVYGTVDRRSRREAAQ